MPTLLRAEEDSGLHYAGFAGENASFWTVEDVLTPAECAQAIQRVEALAVRAPAPRARAGAANSRVVFEDRALAAQLYRRLHSSLPAQISGTAPVSLSERFRSYRYHPGQRFAPHTDGAFLREGGERSELSVIIYLNDRFTGGETRFLDLDRTVGPRAGMALIFPHAVLHEGATVQSGVKYVIRTDVMFRDLAAV